jgi:hypothetical protein
MVGLGGCAGRRTRRLRILARPWRDDGALALQQLRIVDQRLALQVGQLGLGLGGEALIVLALLALGAQPVEGIAMLCLVGLLRAPGVPAGAVAGDLDHRDAIHRAHRQAQVAAGAQLVDDGVHLLRRADDAIHRAGLDAQRAADAPILVDHCQAAWRFDAALRVQRQHRPASQRRQAHDALRTAGRAAVDVGLALGHGLRVGAAVGEAAARALRLRQHCIECVHSLRQSGVGCGGGGIHRAIMPSAGGPPRQRALRWQPWRCCALWPWRRGLQLPDFV